MLESRLAKHLVEAFGSVHYSFPAGLRDCIDRIARQLELSLRQNQTRCRVTRLHRSLQGRAATKTPRHNARRPAMFSTSARNRSERIRQDPARLLARAVEID